MSRKTRELHLLALKMGPWLLPYRNRHPQRLEKDQAEQAKILKSHPKVLQKDKKLARMLLMM